MRVSPVALDACGYCHLQWLSGALYPAETSLFDDIRGGGATATNPAALFFSTIDSLNRSARNLGERVLRDPGTANLWLQFPNDIIRTVALKIVEPSDSDDVKMEKIQRWVVDNIDYMSDREQYGYDELWVPPVMVLNTMKGDCEDGAFLIMSLGLNAGVDPSRLRMYGGLVDAGPGAGSGGHGWVAYRREIDDEWVAVDFSYFPDLRPMGLRTPLKYDGRYIDDYFFMTNQYTVVTEITNRIRDPEIYLPNGSVLPNIFFPAGSLLSLYA